MKESIQPKVRWGILLAFVLAVQTMQAGLLVNCTGQTEDPGGPGNKETQTLFSESKMEPAYVGSEPKSTSLVSAEIALSQTEATTGDSVTFDNSATISSMVVPVPEPITCALAIFGVVFLGGAVARHYWVASTKRHHKSGAGRWRRAT